VPEHILDEAIKYACSKFKAGITNIRKGTIKHFRIRYLKKSKKDKILIVEKDDFSDSYKGKGFFVQLMGSMKLKDPNLSYKTIITGDSTLCYDYSSDRFTLHVPETINTEENNQDETYIGLDAGIRTFLTGVSNKNIVEMGTNMANAISVRLRILDKIKKNEKNIL